MAAPRPVSPILDGFRLEQPLCQHGAAACYAATETASAAPFILKVISIPTSPVQMEAMLMTGAFSDRNHANLYFKEQAREVLNEAKTLRHMAALGGFSDFDSVQVVPAAEENGFEVYLLTPKQTSLQQILNRPDLTQMEIINMGLDLCAALTTCRHAGFYYANLKPSNVFHIGDRYKIGDFGFLPLSSVGTVPLPDRYTCEYTPPELRDGSSPLSSTADVYALGLILYQAYNGGILPGKEDVVGKLLAPPKYADYEMAEIILRACAPDPRIRWNDPEQMGQALARYMQRNGMHNTPIIPSAPEKKKSDRFSKIEEFLPEVYNEEEFQETLWSTQPPAPLPQRRSAPVRKRKAPPHRSPGLIAIIILAVILVIELAVGIWLLTQKDPPPEDEAAFSSTAQVLYTLSAEAHDQKLLFKERDQVHL